MRRSRGKYLIILFSNERRGKKTLHTQWKSFEGCKIVAGPPWGKLGELFETKQPTTERLPAEESHTSSSRLQLYFTSRCLPVLDYTSNPELFLKKVTVAASCPSLLLVLYLYLLRQSPLSVKGFPAWMLRPVLSLHLLHPGHAPVPRRNGLQLAERVALSTERRIQGAEGGGRRGEVWTQRRGRHVDMHFNIQSIKTETFVPAERVNTSGALRNTFHADSRRKSKFRGFFEAAVCHNILMCLRHQNKHFQFTKFCFLKVLLYFKELREWSCPGIIIVYSKLKGSCVPVWNQSESILFLLLHWFHMISQHCVYIIKPQCWEWK